VLTSTQTYFIGMIGEDGLRDRKRTSLTSSGSRIIRSPHALRIYVHPPRRPLVPSVART